MSLLFRGRKPEERRVTTLDWARADDLGSTSSFSSVLSVVPVFAAVRLISDMTATLPLQQFRRLSTERQPMDLSQVFGGDKRVRWVQQAVISLLVRGNAYGRVLARGTNTWPARVAWMHPDDVSVDESGGVPLYRFRGMELRPDEVVHIPAYSVPGTVVGLSPIGACALLGTTGARTQKTMDDWFKNRAIPGSKFRNTQKTLDPKQADAVSEGLSARLRAGKPIVYGSDWEFEPVALSASDAAFLDSARLNATQVATIYGIPPEMIGGDTGASLTYSTVELNTLNFATFTLGPWLAKLEQEFSTWLPAPQQVRFNVDAMVRVDTQTKYDVYRISREIGMSNVDELRALNNQEPLPDGKGQDYTPLAKVGATPLKEAR